MKLEAPALLPAPLATCRPVRRLPRVLGG